MKKKTLLPQIAAPVQRLQITNSSVQSGNQATVEPMLSWNGYSLPGIPFAAGEAD